MANYGIWQEKDLALDAVASTVDREALLDATVETIATHNAEVNRLVSLFSEPTTEAQASVRAGNGVVRSQPLDENGRPLPIKGGGYYFVGFPLFKSGNAEGANFWTDAQMTVQDYASNLDLILGGDVTWVRDQLLSTLLYNGAGYAYTNPQTGNNVTVYGLANGDGTAYNKRSGGGTDDHYSAQANPIDANNNPFPAIFADLDEHPENAGRKVSFIDPNLLASISLLPAFAPAERDIIEVVPAQGGATTDPLYAPALGLPLSRTMKYVGTVGNNYVVTWDILGSLSNSYIITEAVDAAVRPLACREYAQPSLRGFINVGEEINRFPYRQTNYVRAMGFGGKNRVGAHVHRVGNASYAAPTGYAFPIG